MAETTVGVMHPFEPVWDEHSRVLVLGTFPSVKSRANAFYYGHPQNRFWRVLAALYGEAAPETIEQKKALLLRHGVALWDVLQSCDVTGSADASIRHPVPNDVAGLLLKAPIERVLCNGQTAARLYARFCEPLTGLAAAALPSTSPANAGCSLERLIAAWSALKSPAP